MDKILNMPAKIQDLADYLKAQLMAIQGVEDIAPDITLELITAWTNYIAEVGQSDEDITMALKYLQENDEDRFLAYAEVLEDFCE